MRLAQRRKWWRASWRPPRTQGGGMFAPSRRQPQRSVSPRRWPSVRFAASCARSAGVGAGWASIRARNGRTTRSGASASRSKTRERLLNSSKRPSLRQTTRTKDDAPPASRPRRRDVGPGTASPCDWTPHDSPSASRSARRPGSAATPPEDDPSLRRQWARTGVCRPGGNPPRPPIW